MKIAKNFARPNATKRTLPNVFNKKQLIALFENIDDASVFIGCLTALFCGLRISEVCNLKKRDVDLEAEKVIVRQGKGAKDRVVMLPSSIKPLMENWFRYHKNRRFLGCQKSSFFEHNKESEFIISNEYGGQYTTGLLSRKFKEALEKAKLKIETFKSTTGQQRYAYSFHTLRHTYATYLLEQGVDLYYVQRILGHTDIHTTQIYAYISNKDLQSKINGAFGKKKTHQKSYEAISDPLQLLKLKFASGELGKDAFKERYLLISRLENSENRLF